MDPSSVDTIRCYKMDELYYDIDLCHLFISVISVVMMSSVLFSVEMNEVGKTSPDNVATVI